MTVTMITSVRKDDRGRYWASRTFEDLDVAVEDISHDAEFVLKQNKGESVADFEERAREEVRARGIAKVERLN